MPSYVAFRDMSSVFTAGVGFIDAGNHLKQAATTGESSLRGRKGQVFTGGDDYSKDFLKGVYDKDDRVENIFESGNALLENTFNLGPDVIHAAKVLLWTDAVNGAAMYPSRA
jgi:hypothetical protein